MQSSCFYVSPWLETSHSWLILLFTAAACISLFLEGFLHLGVDNNWTVKVFWGKVCPAFCMDLSWDLKSDQLLFHLIGRSKGNRQRRGWLSVREGGGLAPTSPGEWGKSSPDNNVHVSLEKGGQLVKMPSLSSEASSSGKFWLWERTQNQEFSQWEAAHHTVWDLGLCPLVFSQESGVRARLLFSLGRIAFSLQEERKEDNFSGCEQHLM